MNKKIKVKYHAPYFCLHTLTIFDLYVFRIKKYCDTKGTLLQVTIKNNHLAYLISTEQYITKINDRRIENMTLHIIMPIALTRMMY